MACKVKRKLFGNSGGLGPRLDECINGRRQIEHAVVPRLIPAFRHPFQRLVGQWKINRFFGFLHGHSQTVLTVVEEHVFPFQFLHVADAQPAEAGKQVGTLHPLVIHRGGNQ